MPEVVKLSHDDVQDLTYFMSKRISEHPVARKYKNPLVYPIPRGGVPVAYRLQLHRVFQIANNPEVADYFVDDLIDSGATLDRFGKGYGKPFFALLDKRDEDSLYHGKWVQFPWEESLAGDMESTVVRFLEQIGEDPTRGGLVETPARVAKAWLEHWISGYDQDPSSVLKQFEDGGESYDEMILVRDIPFYSHCEHHLAPFFGTADIAYIPNGKIVGLSKLSRLLDIYAHRLQVQERLTAQVANSLMEHLGALGVAVSVRARHLCMESRGIRKQNSQTVTNSMLGVFREDAAARNEFLSSIR